MSKSRKYLWASADFEALSEYLSGIYFSSVVVADNGIMPCCNPVTLHTVLHSIEIRARDAIRSISKLKTNSSCGPDRLPPILFKRLKHCLYSQPLALIYNQLVSVGAVPADWLTAHIFQSLKRHVILLNIG